MFIESLKFKEPVYITRPVLPDLKVFTEKLQRIWENKQLTNDAFYLRAFESALRAYLGVSHVSVVCNGTAGLLIALKALNITGEVITTPFTFPATVNTVVWNQGVPVYADIQSSDCTLDPRAVEAQIGPRTEAILPVHVYGNACAVDEFERLAKRHHLAVIYDAAHAMGCRRGDRSLAGCGDVSVLSFHATKLFTTFEGGAVVSRKEECVRTVNLLRNFGIPDEDQVLLPGINGKMNEVQAAMGLLQLELVDQEISRRKRVAEWYGQLLAGLPGLQSVRGDSSWLPNYSYLPIRVIADQFGRTRDQLHAILRRHNVISRRYFYPLCCDYAWAAQQPVLSTDPLIQARRAVNEILCLPIHGELTEAMVRQVCLIIREAGAPGATPERSRP